MPFLSDLHGIDGKNIFGYLLTCTVNCRTMLLANMNMRQVTITNSSAKSERLEFRVSQRMKVLLQHAAAIQGRSLSDFLFTSAEKAANEVIRENQIIQLSLEDSTAFAQALLNSSVPNSNLKSIYALYKKNVSSK